MGGHGGVIKTQRRIHDLFYWDGMMTEIRQYVAGCSECQRNKYSTLAPGGLLQPLPIPQQIWDDVSMDFVEGLPKSKGWDGVMVVVDRLSKYSHFVGIKHPFTAVDIAELFIKEVVKLHGFPKTIVSDRDRIFLSQFWKEIHRLAGTGLKFSTAYHPQSDGQTEVTNRTMETYLRCFCSEQPKKWADYLPWAELWYNSAFHSSIQTTPFNVVYGRSPPSLIRYETGSTTNADLESRLLERDAMLLQIQEHLNRARQRMKQQADLHRREVEFAVGDWVFLKLRPYKQRSLAKRINQKLSPRFYGPFRVESRVGEVAYRLTLPEDAKIHPVFHVSQLKLAVGDTEEPVAMPQQLNGEGVLEMIPECVLDSRAHPRTGRLEVLIKWRDMPDYECSWEAKDEMALQFPFFNLEDKVGFEGRGIDTYDANHPPILHHYKRRSKQSG